MLAAQTCDSSPSTHSLNHFKWGCSLRFLLLLFVFLLVATIIFVHMPYKNNYCMTAYCWKRCHANLVGGKLEEQVCICDQTRPFDSILKYWHATKRQRDSEWTESTMYTLSLRLSPGISASMNSQHKILCRCDLPRRPCNNAGVGQYFLLQVGTYFEY